MVEEGGVEPPHIPATSKLPGNVARLVVNPDSFYLIKTKLMANIKSFSLKMLIFPPLLRELLPSCTLRWNLKELHFSS